jgi:hypothetical protein
MRILGGIFLLLISLFSGGCSLLFGIADLTGNGFGVAVIWIPGLIIAALTGWGAVKLFAKPKPAPWPSLDADAASDSADAPPSPVPPKSDHW